ncbi:MAG TPA: metal ABC transporter ATP-binding protein [Candidatus Saccharimonadales bacterium]|nr:metal ABC transporter ATP-binding protein [Candidatus Saccharimonadales bacterium]
MKTKNKERITSLSSDKTSQRSAQHSDASRALIDLDNVSLAFGGQTVLDDVSLCIHQGEFIGIIGPNGAGKTTLLKVMLGLLKHGAGSVKKYAGAIGYVPQRSAMHDSPIPISVLEVALLGSRGNKAKAHAALAAVHMANTASKRFTTLSGGQQQRVLIAKALAGDPAVLFLDEPTTGIDERSQAEFYHILAGLQKEGLAIVMVSHDVDTVLSQVMRVVCLNRSIVYDGPPEHFEADKYLPRLYNAQHRMLHHHHGDDDA